jgi:hypothetical protein
MRTLIPSSIIAVTMLACLPPSAASAQTIRVTSPEAAVRARPDVAAEIVTTVKAGTVLDVASRQEKWFEVRLPASGTTPERRGFVLADVVELLPVRDVTAAPPAGGVTPPAAAGAGSLPADWQARRDRALRTERSGRTKIRIAIPIVLTGLAAMLYGTYGSLFSDQKIDAKEWGIIGAGGGLTAVGVVLTARGRTQIASATRELLILEDEKQRVRDLPAVVTFGSDRARVSVTVGAQRIAAAVRLGW